METKTIKDLKGKLIDAVAAIDTDKLTIADLKVLADTVSVISGINDKPYDYMELLSKIPSMGYKYPTLGDMKGE